MATVGAPKQGRRRSSVGRSRSNSPNVHRRGSQASRSSISIDTPTVEDTISSSTKSKRLKISEGMKRLSMGTQKIDEEIMEEKKDKSVCILRVLMIMTLLGAAAIVAGITYYYSHSAEIKEFERQYVDSVVKVEDAINVAMSNKLNSAKTFSAMYTSRYGPENIWPNATMPGTDFIEQATGQLMISNGMALSFNPIIIQDVNREEFEAHATESAHILGAPELVNRSCDDCRVVADGIFRKEPSPTEPGILVAADDPGYSPESRYPYHLVPVWQIYPTAVNWRAVMFNLHSETNRQRALDDMLEYNVPALTALLHLVQHKYMNPSSILFYPVFDRFNDTSNPVPREVVGSISIVFTWEEVLRKVLPAYIEGMIVVLESSVSNELPRQLWTFDVSGETVTIVGEGDTHDPKYNNFEHVVKVNVADTSERLGIVEYLITYQLRMYPSDKFKSKYLTVKPIVMTVVVLLVFALTSLIFRAYDWLVNHRQKQIMSFAKRSGTIVDSLFPSNVRDRLFDNAEHMEKHLKEENDVAIANNDDQAEKSSRHSSIIRQMTKFMPRRDSLLSQTEDHGIQNISTPPIADLFHNTSIMFSDIVGFTKWSSEHEPEEVFHLLETLFLEFDRLATRMNIFKLGTIGDCYIAVTGLPDPRADHAVALCRFAEGCRQRCERVCAELDPVLGGVDKLSMRWGIHSGPITAGVLRGQKSRFELFGDTINTASRMESNGKPKKIQISQETADLVIEAGFEYWLTPREDKIFAKGKGDLQTYWLNIPDEKERRTSLDISNLSTQYMLDISPESDVKEKTQQSGDSNDDAIAHN